MNKPNNYYQPPNVQDQKISGNFMFQKFQTKVINNNNNFYPRYPFPNNPQPYHQPQMPQPYPQYSPQYNHFNYYQQPPQYPPCYPQNIQNIQNIQNLPENPKKDQNCKKT